MTTPALSVDAVFRLARDLDCVGIEFRNDLERPLFDGKSPAAIKDLAAEHNVRILALAEVKAFNDAPETKTAKARALMQTAQACGAEGVALIPRMGDAPLDRAAQRDSLRHALAIYQPMLTDMNLIGFIEPLGFAASTLRHKDDAADVLADMGNPDCFKLVHDTFHHHLSGDTTFYPDLTGIVHISGISDPAPNVADMTDAHRILVDQDDRLGNIAQLQTLRAQGYAGPASFECFAPEIHAITDPSAALAGSITFITAQLTAKAA
ncbi:2-keto-myo-inositol isomerase [Loktanella ponticola]|uniref:2-keto-myo-inositol isomerase n=1 Tax=Yoonia ponticola TaxID=1524255 RepID=A0A7W9BMC2_9RHOB|nr:TIM barrel protein [Yoonia ponticola]MBB5722971.1 2-keto-myo-inositol isomerase [Yoonia ponticola]